MFYIESGEILEQVLQRGGGCSVPANIQDQAIWASEQLKISLLFCRKVGLDDP